MKKYTGVPPAGVRINIFHARKVHQAARARSRRIGQKIAQAVRENAISDRSLEDMTDMSLYLGLPEELALRLYLCYCVPHAAVNEVLKAA